MVVRRLLLRTRAGRWVRVGRGLGWGGRPTGVGVPAGVAVEIGADRGVEVVLDERTKG